MKRVKVVVILIVLILSFEMVDAQRGCCSHHGGVAGCSSSGRTICNDGTYSPSCTCTPPRIYGCTDWNAMNYNSNANTDNGSCRYKKIEYERITIKYETEIRNPNNIENGKETVIQEGINGIKNIEYTIITDSKGNQISKSKTETIITEPTNKIILIEEIEKTKPTTVIENKDNNDENNNSESDELGPGETIIGIATLGGMAYGYKKYKKNKKNKTLML